MDAIAATADRASQITAPWGVNGPSCYATADHATTAARRSMAAHAALSRDLEGDQPTGSPCFKPAPARFKGWPVSRCASAIRRAARLAMATAHRFRVATSLPVAVADGAPPMVGTPGKDAPWIFRSAGVVFTPEELVRGGAEIVWLPVVAIRAEGIAAIGAGVGVKADTYSATLERIVKWGDAHGDTGDGAKAIAEAVKDRTHKALSLDEKGRKALVKRGKGIEKAARLTAKVGQTDRAEVARRTAARDLGNPTIKRTGPSML
ncbi:MAG: hypothetical protein P1V36_01735 [Planctomycetota bacterium]|nr:hypothetical protein [Planctomycetota bacterium]